MEKIPHTNQNPLKYLENQPKSSLFLSAASPWEIKKILNEIPSKYSSGWDDIPSVVVKKPPDNVLVALSHIFNLSLNTGIFPNLFKKAKIIPIPKVRNPKTLNQYRPISLLPIFSKILEKIVHKRFYSFLTLNSLLSPTQFGFRKLYSTSHAATYLANAITNSLDKKQMNLGIFLDLRKAFDIVDHSILQSKLQKYGVRGNAYKWFSSYLADRSQTVCYHFISSTNDCLTSRGVPQRSVLGPLLFSLYVNDFHNCLKHCSSVMFVDHTSVFLSEKSVANLQAKGNAELLNIDTWLASNKLSLNIDKTNFMLFKTKATTTKQKSVIKLTLRVKSIKQVFDTKFLGLTLDETLSWKTHTQNLLKQVHSTFGIVRASKGYLNSHSLKLLYYTMIQSKIQYCITTWCHGNKTIKTKLQNTCNKCIKLINKKQPKINDSIKSFPFLSIDQLLSKEIATFMYKFNNKLLPKTFENFFQLNQPNNRATRSNSQIIPISCSTNIGQQSMQYLGPKIWNNLSKLVKDCIY